MSNWRRNLALIVIMAIAATVGVFTFGVASAADPVTVTLKSWTEGTTTVVDVSITNSTTSNMGLDIKAYLPAGATFVGASPQVGSQFVGNYVHWVGLVSAGRTLVGYQYKFKGTGNAVVSVDYLGSSRGTVTATVAAAAPSVAQLALAPTTPPVAKLEIVPVPALATHTYAITGTLPGTTTTVAFSTSGLPNVSVGVPVTLKGSAVDPTSPAKSYAWTLARPSSSKAALKKADAEVAQFTPDVVGVYKLDLVVKNEAGSSPMVSVQIRADKYIGVEQGGCVKCHTAKVAEWAETPHGTKLARELNGSKDPKNAKYNEGCVRCHAVGYVIGVENGGFAELQAKTGWKFPSLAAIQSGKGNWEAVPAALQNVSNIQCENCHGPASQHVASGAKMAKSLDADVCNACHAAGGSHTRGDELANSAHSKADAQAWTYPTGASRQSCVRCHSGSGLISFLANPKESASWNNQPQTLTCAVCHDPHSEANKMQLRITGVPVEAVGITKNFGLSAICVECHNTRVISAEAAAAGSSPHYSQAGELLAGTGGIDYGQKINESAHVSIVGAAPVKNPRDATGATYLFGGNAPGACVACHMAQSPADAKDPNKMKLGQHSFNLVASDGTQYTGPCQACHPGAKSFADMKVKGDYDGNGKVETAAEEVYGMLKVLRSAIDASGIKPLDARPYFDDTNKAKWTTSQKNAIFNYLFVKGRSTQYGKSAAIHNFNRSISLLQLSYKDLTGKVVPNATMMVQ